MIASGVHVAVIGGGAAGLAAAEALRAHHRVTLIAAEPRLGGHAWTWLVPEGPDAGLPLDLGFMVLNDRNYPTMHRLLDRLGIAVAETEMSFGFWDEIGGLGYVVNGPPTPGRAPDPRFRQTLTQILKFQRTALRALDADAIGDVALGDYLADQAVPAGVVDDYLIPMGAAIWSSSPAALRAYPAKAFLTFFRHHGLLSLDPPPRWQHIPGGARRYVAAIAGRPDLRVITQPAVQLVRGGDGVEVHLADGSVIAADYAVVATQADQALALLDRPSAAESAGLELWRYQRNHAMLHTDRGVMPAESFWASWNVRRRGAEDDVAFTYDLNRLQNHRTAARRYFLTMATDPAALPRIADDATLLTTTFRHPIFTPDACAAVTRLRDLHACTARRTFFCGSYFGYGFHEDAMASAAAVTRHFGCAL